MRQIAYIGNQQKLARGMRHWIEESFGGSHGNVKYHVPAATPDGSPRIVTLANNPFANDVTDDEREACLEMLLGTGLYVVYTPSPAPRTRKVTEGEG